MFPLCAAEQFPLLGFVFSSPQLQRKWENEFHSPCPICKRCDMSQSWAETDVTHVSLIQADFGSGPGLF